MDYTTFLTLFILGAIFGSFINVIIYRVPREISVIRPLSACPSCRHQLKWFENVPVISYLILRGKCRNCNVTIPLIYPLIELLTGLIFIFLYLYTDTLMDFIFLSFVSTMFISISIIDYQHFIIPDKLLFITAIVSIMYFIYLKEILVVDHLISAVILFFILFLLRFGSSKLFKKESLGMGDLKLGALIGFLLGWKAALLAILFGFYLAAFVLVLLFSLKIVNKNSYIPFGPFMMAGMFIYILWGSLIINWYMRFSSGH